MLSAMKPRVISEVVARAAAYEIEPDVGALSPHYEKAVREVVSLLSWNSGFCPLCGRRFSTRRGYYIHLVRSHSDDITVLVDRVAGTIAGGRTSLGF